MVAHHQGGGNQGGMNSSRGDRQPMPTRKDQSPPDLRNFKND